VTCNLAAVAGCIKGLGQLMGHYNYGVSNCFHASLWNKDFGSENSATVSRFSTLLWSRLH